MNTTLVNEGHSKLSLWQNIRLVPLFSLIFGGILFSVRTLYCYLKLLSYSQ